MKKHPDYLTCAVAFISLAQHAGNAATGDAVRHMLDSISFMYLAAEIAHDVTATRHDCPGLDLRGAMPTMQLSYFNNFLCIVHA